VAAISQISVNAQHSKTMQWDYMYMSQVADLLLTAHHLPQLSSSEASVQSVYLSHLRLISMHSLLAQANSIGSHGDEADEAG